MLGADALEVLGVPAALGWLQGQVLLARIGAHESAVLDEAALGDIESLVDDDA